MTYMLQCFYAYNNQRLVTFHDIFVSHLLLPTTSPDERATIRGMDTLPLWHR